MAAITPQGYFDENAANRIAIAKDNMALKWYISYSCPDWNIVECDDQKAVEKAVLDGDADCFAARASQVTKYIKDNKFHSVFLMKPDNASFAVSRGESVLLSVLNKTLKSMPSSMLTGALFMHDSDLRKVTAMDFIKDNLLAVTVVFALAFLLILAFLRKSLVAEAKAKEASTVFRVRALVLPSQRRLWR